MSGPGILTAGWSRPRVLSRILRASFSRWAASLYLFWSLESSKIVRVSVYSVTISFTPFERIGVHLEIWDSLEVRKPAGARIKLRDTHLAAEHCHPKRKPQTK